VAGPNSALEERRRRGSGFELRLERAGAYASLPPQPLAPGLDLLALSMEIPEARPPFDGAAGASQFRHRRCDLERVELALGEEAVANLVALLELSGSGLGEVAIALRGGFAEGTGALEDGTPYSFKAALVAAGEQGIGVVVYEPRLYAPSPVAAAALGGLLARAAGDHLRPEGLVLRADPLPTLLRRILPARGWKVPRVTETRVAVAEIATGRLRLGWDRAAAAALAPPDPDLLVALEGARAFAPAEARLALGDVEGARQAYRDLGSQASSHPFGASRLLSLLTAEPSRHEEALALCGAVLQRRKDFPAALLARAQVHLARGEPGRAAPDLAALASIALRRGEEGSALLAAEATIGLGPSVHPEAVGRAVEIALSLRREHLPALRALRALGEQGDREALLRACRRLAAYAPDAREKCDAHARLGALLVKSDLTAARLHLDHALRLAPSEPEVLSGLARTCEAAGDALRAVRALDRVKELAVHSSDKLGAARATLAVAALWERTGQLDNALLRAREACVLFPSAGAEALAADLSERLGETREATLHYARHLELIEGNAPDAKAKRVAALAALAHLAEAEGDLEGALRHLTAACAEAPEDPDTLGQLERLQAKLPGLADRRETLDRLARCAEEPAERVRALCQAARLSADEPAEARRRFEELLCRLDGEDVPEREAMREEALEGLASAAAAQHDLEAEREALRRLAECAEPGEARAAVLDRLAPVTERCGDAAGALAAAASARREAPSRARLECELRLARVASPRRAAEILGELLKEAGDVGETVTLLLDRAALWSEVKEPALALEEASRAARLDPERPDAHELLASLAAGRDPRTEAEALLARARLATRANEPDVALRLSTAGQAALAAGLEEAGEAALVEALHLGLDPEEARAAWAALHTRAVERDDPGAEEKALEALVPLLPTPQRPAALMRISALALLAGDAVRARAAAERARTLAPRDPLAVEACRAAAVAQGDTNALPEIYSALSALEPARAGELLLERARQLQELDRVEEADRALAEALEACPPDLALSTEHARQRRAHAGRLAGRRWGEPLEAFARRSPDRHEAARALREAALLALSQGDPSSALRAARLAFEHTPDDLGFAGPLLANLLYRQGAQEELMPLLVRMLEAGLPGTDQKGGAELCRALAELAREKGDAKVELAALDRLLALEPQDVGTALRRFELDPDRSHAVQALAAAAPGTRLARLRALALARAAAAARRELSDPTLADALFARARTAAGDNPAVLSRVEACRVEAIRPEIDPAAPYPPSEFLDALRDLALAREAANDLPGTSECLEELVEIHSRHGLLSEALHDLEKLEAHALKSDDRSRAGRVALRIGLLLIERTGDPERIEPTLRRAAAHAPGELEIWRSLEAFGRTQGPEGSGVVLDAILGRLEIEPADHTARREAARLFLERGQEDEARRVLEPLGREQPEGQASVAALERALAECHTEWAELCEKRAAAVAGKARAELLRQVARARAGAGDDALARAAARAAYDADPSDEVAFEGALRDARGDPERLSAVLRSRAAAVPSEAARHHRARAEALEEAGRPADALGAWEDLLGLEPDDAVVLAKVADGKSTRDGDLAARTEDARLVSRAEAGDPGATPEREARSRFRLGFLAAEGGRAEEAALHLVRALALAPFDPRATRALVLLSSNEHTPAEMGEAGLSLARRLADAASDEFARREVLEAGARLALRGGDRGAEAASLLEALAALALTHEGDETAEAIAHRALDALLRQGENARANALVALAARVARGARRAAWLARLAASAAARGDLAAARAAREEALAADPTDAALRETHLADLEAAGDPAASLRALDAALAVEGADIPSLSLRRARAQIALGDSSGAVKSFEAARELTGATQGSGDVARELTSLLEARGDWAGMARIEVAQAGSCAEPAARAASFLRGAVLFERAGDFGKARELAERARETVPDDAAPHRVVARVAQACGDDEAAAHALCEVAARSSGTAAAGAALEAARLLEARGQEEEAVKALELAVHAESGVPEGRRALAARARARGDLAAAAEHLSALDEGALSPEERVLHQRALALALSDASLPGAEAAWERVFNVDPADAEAFDRLAAPALGRRDSERWLALAAEHDGALSGVGETARRRELRCQRAALLTDLGRLDAAEGAWQAALAMDPSYRPALHGLRALLERRGDHAGAADTLALEAKLASDPLEAAELLLDEARMHGEKLRDRQRAAVVLGSALERLSGVAGERARHLVECAERMRIELAPSGALPGSSPPPRPEEAGVAPSGEGRTEYPTLPFYALAETHPAAPTRPEEEFSDDDPSPVLDDRLRELANAAEGAARARFLDRLSARLERRGERRAAALATLEALDAEPSDAERFTRALTLSGDDRPQLLAAHRLRARGAGNPKARAQALSSLGTLLAASPESLSEAAEALERASGLLPESGAIAAELARVLIALGQFDRALAALSTFENGAEDLPREKAALLSAQARQGVELVRTPETAPAVDALEEAWSAARAAPTDRTALASLASRASERTATANPEWTRRLGLLARVASELGAFAQGHTLVPCAARPVGVSDELRRRASHPTARGALARLLALLAPWLEGLFPADLVRRGVSARHRVSPQRSGETLNLLDEIGRALGTRSVVAFLSDAEGFSVAVENTQPASLILAGGFLGSFPAQERRFLIARGLVLADLGWALLGKFAPPDVGLLCDLACRFGGAGVGGAGLPPERARPFLEALERLVPATLREQARRLAAEAAGGLASLSPRELVGAVRQTSSRIALLHVGCVHAALEGLLKGEPRLRGLTREQALSHPDVRDLAAFAISREGIELRADAEEHA